MKTLNLARNSLKDEAKSTADLLKTNTTITSLDLWLNDISEKGAKYF